MNTTDTTTHALTVCPQCGERAALGRVDRAVEDAGSRLMRRRYPPTGSTELWITYGPAGPPDCGEGR